MYILIKDIITKYAAHGFKGKKMKRDGKLSKDPMTREDKQKWLKLLCRQDLTNEEWEGILKNSWGLRKVFIANEEWRCVVDLVKSKLTAGSCTSDIALWMLPVVEGLSKGQIYKWAQLLSKTMKE